MRKNQADLLKSVFRYEKFKLFEFGICIVSALGMSW